MKLRHYQQDALNAVYEYLASEPGNPLVVIPTGGGKTPIIATICRDAAECGKRVLVLTHVKELLTQSAEKLRLVAPDLSFGVYCAGLGQKECADQIVLASIQSAYRRAKQLGAFDLVIIDEAHRVPEDEKSMYRLLLRDLQSVNPQVRLIGFTATPYRLDAGDIYGQENSLFHHVVYEVSILQLIEQGYLCKLTQVACRAQIDLAGVHVRNGEYIMEEVEERALDELHLRAACEEIVARAHDRNSILVFSPGCRHAERVEIKLNQLGIGSRLVHHRTPKAERDELVKDFREGRLRCLVNVELFTIGFDAPNVDCIVLLRPTLSASLYYQMVGRGLRIYPEKRDCLVLDFAGNIARHGPLDRLRQKSFDAELSSSPPWPDDEEEEALEEQLAEAEGESEYEKSRNDPKKHSILPEERLPILSALAPEQKTEHIEALVRRVEYHVHTKRGAGPDYPKSMRVDYYLDDSPLFSVSEWVCLDHAGFPRKKAERWLDQRLRPGWMMPETVAEAVHVGREGGYFEPKTILVSRKPNEVFWTVVQWYCPERGKAYDAR